MSNLVGHSSKVGCCMYCPIKGCHKPGASQYYPVLLKPHNYSVVWCDHDDVNVYNLPLGTSEGYVHQLKHLMASPNQTQFEKQRLETGIVGPSILPGLQPQHVLGVPECFSSEIMHYSGANMASLYTVLWRGTIDCRDTWEEHGHAVTACKSYLLGSFDVAPHDPNLKMNSFYKAVEYIMWLYYLCPALLYGILSDNVWQNFCKFACLMDRLPGRSTHYCS
ncbi:hypothetical protein CY34DRAFT_27083 [Suillus luteus UH-Slu-Lm8-n1]|uniref:Unplaced genomic scaffold CY34scaffold_874, whole genome shotgun sequence n=1 Tax=Suillus luteus UH-Slu-Lm8-n1 TaxID=930992 RepID=A0A0D0AG17_9AGAM|nr:hypothetical protein CY34DRAFT_27083 [Suillus luteus UH-Slu-Lm8-n1]